LGFSLFYGYKLFTICQFQNSNWLCDIYHNSDISSANGTNADSPSNWCGPAMCVEHMPAMGQKEHIILLIWNPANWANHIISVFMNVRGELKMEPIIIWVMSVAILCHSQFFFFCLSLSFDLSKNLSLLFSFCLNSVKLRLTFIEVFLLVIQKLVNKFLIQSFKNFQILCKFFIVNWRFMVMEHPSHHIELQVLWPGDSHFKEALSHCSPD
jgi:hypothetical protein